jgi:hypothetical protein
VDKQKFKRRLGYKISARLHMSLICLATISAGIFMSKGLLWLEFSEPAIRYGLAVLFSYGIFFALVYWWLMIHFNRRKTYERSSNNDIDSLEMLDITHSNMNLSTNPSTSWIGDGGKSSGGGASDSWGPPSHSTTSTVRSKESIDLVDSVGGDEATIVVLFIFVLAAVFGSAGYLIYQAPEILFEAAFEVVLVTGLAKQAKKMGSEGWHNSIFKKTWWLCAVVLVFAVTFGLFIKKQCPEAASFGQYRELCLIIKR